ncbi:anti-phage dCTP deaminase [Pseudoxanthomonas sp. F11]|uniref:anti-phage dCTP deaminase n=1 Tax=Pseudoxanthomonas sp. F11 TaxID=3126308 RepID=UPI00300D5138
MAAIGDVGAPQLKAVPGGGNNKRLRETLNALQSRELVLGFSGPIGSGLKSVINLFETNLLEIGYTVVRVKISDLIQKYATSKPDLTQTSKAYRYEYLQEQGNALRSDKENNILAQLAVMHISVDRAKRHPGQDLGEVTPGKVAYLIDQLKHPEEIELLRGVYGANFFLLGVLCGYEQRKQNLKSEGVSASEAENLMERDRKQQEKYGQKLEKTLQYADFFLRNARSNTLQIEEPIVRFLHLMHGKVGVTPTEQEQGMYAAYSAALGSACLSRQVGAAIQDKDGKLIATGCNDVPKGGGGLYKEGDGLNDHRCVHLDGGMCFNHREKDTLRSEVEQLARVSLLKELSKVEELAGKEQRVREISNLLASSVANQLREESRIKDLLEFSRSVHAEMDALVALARTGSASASGGVLYTTTYPCHNCARHIIAAGIRAVYFIEPYEKSLAVELHGDAIDHTADEEPGFVQWERDGRLGSKVSFLHFEGVAPRRYLDLFSVHGERKDPSSGRAVQFYSRSAEKRIPQFLEGYIDVESRVVKHLKTIGIEAAGNLAPEDGGGPRVA